MSIEQPVSIEPLPRFESGGLDLVELARRVWARRVRVLAITLGAALITLGIAFLMPKWYRSTATILPPDDSDLLANLSVAQRAISKFPSMGMLPDIFTPADIFKAILLSRTVEDEVIRAHDLQQVYHLKSHEKTLKKLKSLYSVKLMGDGTISISVDDRSPQRAAAMAATFLSALDRFNVERRNSQAHRTRQFLERRVAEVDSTLATDEARLRSYQEIHHTVAPPSATSGDVQAAADVLARKMMLEVRLGVLQSYLQPSNEQVVQTREELEQMNLRIGQLPGLQSELGKLMREVKIQEQLYLLLTSELEQARIRETMDTPTIQVLDDPVPPERHVRPRRFLLAAAGGLAAFLCTAAWIGMRDPDPARSS